jgi:hypothetical protein
MVVLAYGTQTPLLLYLTPLIFCSSAGAWSWYVLRHGLMWNIRLRCCRCCKASSIIIVDFLVRTIISADNVVLPDSSTSHSVALVSWSVRSWALPGVSLASVLSTFSLLIGISKCQLLPVMVSLSMNAQSKPQFTDYDHSWYKRSEFGIRAAIFVAAGTISGAFGGLLAYGISFMDGVGGKPAWSWIFILGMYHAHSCVLASLNRSCLVEGLATVVAGIVSFWIIQDFPDTAKFLSEAERTVVVRRLQSDDQISASGENLKLRVVWNAISSWKVWLCMIMYAGSAGPVYAFSLFLPSIISQVCLKTLLLL